MLHHQTCIPINPLNTDFCLIGLLLDCNISVTDMAEANKWMLNEWMNTLN